MSGRSLQEARDEVAEAQAHADANDPAPLDQAAESLDRRIMGWITEDSDVLIEDRHQGRGGRDPRQQQRNRPRHWRLLSRTSTPTRSWPTAPPAILKAWQTSRELNQQLEDLRAADTSRPTRWQYRSRGPTGPRASSHRPARRHSCLGDPQLVTDFDFGTGYSQTCAPWPASGQLHAPITRRDPPAIETSASWEAVSQPAENPRKSNMTKQGGRGWSTPPSCFQRRLR